MTKDERLQKAEVCLQNAEKYAGDERAQVYLQAADLWLRLAISAD